MLHPEPWGGTDARRPKVSRQPHELPIVAPRTDPKSRAPKSWLRLWLGDLINNIMSKATAPLRAAWAAYNRSLQVRDRTTASAQHLLDQSHALIRHLRVSDMAMETPGAIGARVVACCIACCGVNQRCMRSRSPGFLIVVSHRAVQSL